MTLDSKLSKNVYQGNGSTTVFPFAFKVWSTSQVAVTMTDTAGVSTDVTSNSTVTLSSSGGSVTYPKSGSPLPGGAKLAITRNMPFIQGINLVSTSRFDPQVLEDGLDQATAERQQIVEMMERAVILPPTSSESPQDVVATIYASRDAAAASAEAATASANAASEQATAAKNSADTASQTVQTATAQAVADATAQANAAHNSALDAARSAADAEAASGGLAGRVDAVETKNSQQDTRLADVESKNTQQDTRLASAETALTGKANADLGNVTGNAISKYLHVRDEKAQGVSGGSTTSGAWNTRDLNTIKVNRIGATLASNRVTLPAGTYYIKAISPCFASMHTRLCLYNVTATSTLLIGPTGRANSGSAHILETRVEGEFTFAVPTTLEVRMYTASGNTYGMGYPESPIAGVNEVYSEFWAWKVQ